MPKISCDNIKPSRNVEKLYTIGHFTPGDILYAPGCPGSPFIKLEGKGMASLRDGCFLDNNFLCYPLKTKLIQKKGLLSPKVYEFKDIAKGCLFFIANDLLMKIEDYFHEGDKELLSVRLSDGKIFVFPPMIKVHAPLTDTFYLENRED